jgi:cyclophilin family peptidyl-prolyl cis-trans isomerase
MFWSAAKSPEPFPSLTNESLAWFRARRDKWLQTPRTRIQPLDSTTSININSSSNEILSTPSKPKIPEVLLEAHRRSVERRSEKRSSQKLLRDNNFNDNNSNKVEVASTDNAPSALTLQAASESAGATTDVRHSNIVESEHELMTELPVVSVQSILTSVPGTTMPSRPDYRDRLISFYKKHNPAKLNSVNETLKSYLGREDELFCKLHAKYDVEPAVEQQPTGPICFFEFAGGRRVLVRLFAAQCPRAAENFRALCTGERGLGRSGRALCYRNNGIHRVVQDFCVQGGDITKGDGTGGESIYAPGQEFTDLWGNFKDEVFLNHDKGVLSMANNGKDRNSSQFFITLRSLPNLNNKHVVFGKVIKGMDVVEEIGRCETDAKQRPLDSVVIQDCGQILENGKEFRASESMAKTLAFGAAANTISSSASNLSTALVKDASNASKQAIFGVPANTPFVLGQTTAPLSVGSAGSTANASIDIGKPGGRFGSGSAAANLSFGDEANRLSVVGESCAESNSTTLFWIWVKRCSSFFQNALFTSNCQ